MLEYLTHSNESQKNKHRYETSEVYANFDFVKQAEIEKCLGDFDHFSYAQQLLYIGDLIAEERLPAYTKLKKFWEIECQVRSLKSDRDIEVIFITGDGGCGKTSYAKELFKKRGFDFCLSSASNDPFQDYKGQNGLLLDDFRDRVILYEDLLKVLDNHNSSSMYSRFNNKVFMGKMIIITSCVPLCSWYKSGVRRDGQTMRLSGDELWQLYRRITCYVQMDNKEIIVYNDGLDKYGRPKGAGECIPNTLLSHFKHEEKARTDYASLMRDIASDYGSIQSELPFGGNVSTNENIPK
jgi:hypothetical protein